MQTQVFQGILIPFLGTAPGSACVLSMPGGFPGMPAGKHSNLGSVLFAAGFTVMMALDVALG